MFDLSSKFNSFYNSYVVLSQEEQNTLQQKKTLNVQRLKDGLAEYNAEKNTNYSVAEVCVQGSMAMSTIVQNDSHDYDIDVAVVFDKEKLGDKGPLATRNIVAAALRKKTKQFKVEPEVKTSCVRIKYSDGYHIDFAVFRREFNDDDDCWNYEHAGAEWAFRELHGLTNWFKEENQNTEGRLRKVVRLSKMFCNSRSSWKNMPSGLLQTVLCSECIANEYSRNEELFYYSMRAIVDRLEKDTSVSAPVDNGRDLTPRNIDRQKMTNWKNRLKSKLEDLEILFSEECTEEEAIQAWFGFFNHEYWTENRAVANSLSYLHQEKSAVAFNDSEQFIEDQYPVNLIYSCKVSCVVSGDGFRPKKIEDFLSF